MGTIKKSASPDIEKCPECSGTKFAVNHENKEKHCINCGLVL